MTSRAIIDKLRPVLEQMVRLLKKSSYHISVCFQTQ